MGATIGSCTVRRASFSRRLAMDALDAIRPGHNMMALLEIDVTRARRTLRARKRAGEQVSLFAFLLKSIAVVLSEHPQLNAIRSGYRVVESADIDISVPIELSSEGERVARQLVIRRAAQKTVPEMHAEIEAARLSHRAAGAAGEEDRLPRRLMRALFLLPRFVRILLLRRLINDPYAVKQSGGGVESRDILSLTVCFNHDLVDGAPAARFTSRLRKCVESVEVLQ